MIYLYHGSGAGDLEIVGQGLDAPAWARLRDAAFRLLEARAEAKAADYLRHLPFLPFQGTNHFNDDFVLIEATVPIERYAVLQPLEKDKEARVVFRAVAEALGEVGYPVRFIVVAPDTSGVPDLVPAATPTITSDSVSRALTDAEVLLHQTGAASAVDRVHTAMHAHLRAVC